MYIPSKAASGSGCTATSSHRASEYDKDGHLIDESTMLQEAGLEVGVYVKENKNNLYGIIEAVGGGKLSIRTHILKTEAVVTYLAFRDEWSIVYDRAELKDRGVVTNYTEHLADSSEEIALQRAWGRVQLGLDLASRWIAAEKKQPLLRIETKPKKVFALAHVEPYGLYLLPHSTSYAYDSKTNGKSFVVDPLWIDSQQRAGSKVVYIEPCFSTDKFAEPFWAVRRVEHSSAEADAANMVVVSVKSDYSIRTTGSIFGSSPARADQQSITTLAIANMEPLNDGDELLLAGVFASKKEKRTLYVM